MISADPADPALRRDRPLLLLLAAGLLLRVGSRRAALFSLALWTFSPYFLTQGENGLETGLFGLALAATLDYHLSKGRTLGSASNSARLGFLLGLTILSRVDGVLFAAAVGYDLMRRPRAPGERARHLALASSVA